MVSRWNVAWIAVAAAVVCASSLRSAQAQKYPEPMSPENVETLSHKAKLAYNDAQRDIDKVIIDRALTRLAESAQEDKNHIPLQLYVSRMFQVRAMKSTGNQAKAYFDAAIAPLDNIIASPMAKPADLELAKERKAKILKEKEKVDAKDKRFAEIGKAVQAAAAEDNKKPLTAPPPPGNGGAFSRDDDDGEREGGNGNRREGRRQGRETEEGRHGEHD